MALTILRATTFEDKDFKTGEVKQMQRLVIMDETGYTDVIAVPVGAKDEDVRKVWDEKLKTKSPLTGKVIK